MQNQKTIQFYQSQLEKYNVVLKKAKSKVRTLGFLRLVVFILIVGTNYFTPSWQFALIILPIEIGLFIYLVNQFLNAKELRQKVTLLIALNHNEILALNGNWSNFQDGVEYKSGSHPFSLDMDLFGPKSFFQLVNRTALKAGSKKLASVLACGSQKIALSKMAISSFSTDMDWCQHFIIEGQLRVSNDVQKSLPDLTKINFPKAIISVFKWAIPIVSFGILALYLFNLIQVGVLIVGLVLVLSLVGQFLKSSNKVIFPTTSLSNEVGAMIKQLELLKSFQNQKKDGLPFIAELTEGDSSVLKSLKSLESIQKRMSFRDNILVGTLLNAYLAWDFRVIDQFKNWMDQHGFLLQKWEDQLAEIEVWVSGAVYHFNFPKSTFAEFSDSNQFEIKEMGHPFVDQEKQVKNDIAMAENEQFLIITGPNMAGKSTYLRSVGIAILSANAGFPVLAKSCSIPKLELYSSMRTSDDLTVESSYFHAELTRLRFIMDAIESGKKTFVILDEILKGTNSKDKEIGSARFLEKLNRLSAQGIIATHDLSLTKLSENNLSFRNVYFDSTISGDSLSFDYLVREGVCQNMNASFLLKQMKLVD